MGPATGAGGNPHLGAVRRASENAVPIGDTRELPGMVLVIWGRFLNKKPASLFFGGNEANKIR